MATRLGMWLVGLLFSVKIGVKIRWLWVKRWFWTLPIWRMGEILRARSSLTRYEIVVLCLFVLLVGVGLGQWWRIAQVEPIKDQIIMGMLEEIREQRRKIAKDVIDFETRLGMLEGKNKREATFKTHCCC